MSKKKKEKEKISYNKGWFLDTETIIKAAEYVLNENTPIKMPVQMLGLTKDGRIKGLYQDGNSTIVTQQLEKEAAQAFSNSHMDKKKGNPVPGGLQINDIYISLLQTAKELIEKNIKEKLNMDNTKISWKNNRTILISQAQQTYQYSFFDNNKYRKPNLTAINKEETINEIFEKFNSYLEQIKPKMIKNKKQLWQTNQIINLFDEVAKELYNAAKKKYQKLMNLNCNHENLDPQNPGNVKYDFKLTVQKNNIEFNKSITIYSSSLKKTNTIQLYGMTKFPNITWNISKNETKEYTIDDIKIKDYESTKENITKYLKQKMFGSGIVIKETNVSQMPKKVLKEREKFLKTNTEELSWYIPRKAEKNDAKYSFAKDSITYETEYGFYDEKGNIVKYTTQGNLIKEHIDESVKKQRLQFIKKQIIPIAKKAKLTISCARNRNIASGPAELNFKDMENGGKLYIRPISFDSNDPDWNCKLQNLFEDVVKEKNNSAETEKTIAKELCYDHMLNIIVATTINNNPGCSINSLTSDLCSKENNAYSFMTKSEFSGKVKTTGGHDTISGTIDKLEAKNAVTLKQKKGKHAYYTGFYPTNITKAILSVYQKEKKKILLHHKMKIALFIEKLDNGQVKDITTKNYLELIDENNQMLDFSLNLPRLIEIFADAPAEIIKLIEMKKKTYGMTNIYNPLIKAYKEKHKKTKQKVQEEKGD